MIIEGSLIIMWIRQRIDELIDNERCLRSSIVVIISSHIISYHINIFNKYIYIHTVIIYKYQYCIRHLTIRHLMLVVVRLCSASVLKVAEVFTWGWHMVTMVKCPPTSHTQWVNTTIGTCSDSEPHAYKSNISSEPENLDVK